MEEECEVIILAEFQHVNEKKIPREYWDDLVVNNQSVNKLIAQTSVVDSSTIKNFFSLNEIMRRQFF